jgi:chromosomal replication initiation ATPase DnaA
VGEFFSLWRGVISVPTPEPTMKQITAEVAEKHGFGLLTLIGPDVTRDVTNARHEAWSRIRSETSKSYPQIGAFFGRDHTTVCTRVRAWRGKNGVSA